MRRISLLWNLLLARFLTKGSKMASLASGCGWQTQNPADFPDEAKKLLKYDRVVGTAGDAAGRDRAGLSV